MFNLSTLLSSPSASPAFLVAEIGINHDGNAETARSMIDAAAEAGADAVKFQIYSTEGFYSPSRSPEAFALFQKLSLPLPVFYGLRAHALRRGLLCFAAPFSQDVLDDLILNEVFPVKIASGDASTEPWLDLLLQKNIPFIVSCGGLGPRETETLAHKICGAPAALLYCVSQYPAPPELFDLQYIDTLRGLLPNGAVGFSDHSRGIALSLAAAARGAKIIERHFTLQPERGDLDHPLSLDPGQFASLVEGVRAIEKALGSGQRALSPAEARIRPLAGRSVFLNVPLRAGEIIREHHLALLRPGKGVSTQFYQSLLGKACPRDMEEGENLSSLWEP